MNNKQAFDSYTLPKLFISTVQRFPQHVALGWRQGERWASMTYVELANHVSRSAQVFLQLGIHKGDRVAILSENRPDWAVADLGIQCTGGINVPLYHTQSESQLFTLLEHCGASIVLVSGGELLKKIEQILDKLPKVQHVVYFDRPLDPPRRKNLHHWQHLMDSVPQRDLSYITELALLVHPSQCASIVYTSGTTGMPKGVMLSHQNFCANVEANQEALPLSDADRVLSFLPLSHVFERTCGYYTIIGIGGSIFYARSLDTVAQDMTEVHPTAVITVPRLFEKMHASILEKIEAAGKRKIFDWALTQGKAMQTPPAPSLLTQIKYKLANLLVFSKLKKRTGGRLRFFVSGGAPLPKALGEFFSYAGLTIIEGYGLTETAPVLCCNRLSAIKYGSIGLPLFNVEVRLSEDNELEAKGPNIMLGYYQNPADTQSAMTADGWFRTGDFARIDDDGFVWITGRKKQLIVLSNGKKISPDAIENALVESRFIDQAVLFGDNRNYVLAVLVPAENYLKAKATEAGLADSSIAELLENPTVQAWFLDDVRRVSAAFARFEQPKRILLRAKGFTQDEGTLTPSLKIIRAKVADILKKDIEAIYKQEESDLCVALA